MSFSFGALACLLGGCWLIAELIVGKEWFDERGCRWKLFGLFRF
jgi:hypothetical protein